MYNNLWYVERKCIFTYSLTSLCISYVNMTADCDPSSDLDVQCIVHLHVLGKGLQFSMLVDDPYLILLTSCLIDR